MSVGAAWMPYLDGVGCTVRQDADKSQLLAAFHKRHGIRLPESHSRRAGYEPYSYKRHGKEDLWSREWMANWVVAGGTPCLLWLQGQSCVVLEKRCRDPGHAFPRITYVTLDFDGDLFGGPGGTVIEGEIVAVPGTDGQPKSHAFMAEDLLCEAGRPLIAGGGSSDSGSHRGSGWPSSRRAASPPLTLSERLIRLQTLLERRVRFRPGLDVCAFRMRHFFSPSLIEPSIKAMRLNPSLRLDYGGNRGCPIGVVLRPLVGTSERRILFRVYHGRSATTATAKATAAAAAAASAKAKAKAKGANRDGSSSDGIGGSSSDGSGGSSDESDGGGSSDDDDDVLSKEFYVRATHISDVYELFDTLDAMDSTPINRGMVPIAGVPTMEDAEALRALAARRTCAPFESSVKRLNGKWVIMRT